MVDKRMGEYSPADEDKEAALTKMFGKDYAGMDEAEKNNARVLYDKMGDNFTEDDVKYHATNPSGRLMQTDQEPDMEPYDQLFTPVVKGKK